MINYNMLYNIEMVTNGEKIWFYAEKTGFVTEIDCSSGQMDCLFFVPNINNECRILCYSRGFLFLLPYNSDVIYIYDLCKKKLEKMILTDEKNKCLCTGAVFFADELYIYGTTSLVYKYSFKKKGISSVLDMKEKAVGFKALKENEDWFWGIPSIYNEKLYLLMYRNGIIVIDKNENVSFLPLGTGTEEWVKHDMYICDDKIHVLCSDTQENVIMAIYDMKGRIIKKSNIKIDYQYSALPYLRTRFTDKGWLTFPYLDNTIRCVNTESGEINSIYTCGESDKVMRRECYGATAVIGNDNSKIVTIDLENKLMLEIDAYTLDVCEKEIVFNEHSRDRFRKIAKEKMEGEHQVICNENEIETLDLYVSAISSRPSI